MPSCVGGSAVQAHGCCSIEESVCRCLIVQSASSSASECVIVEIRLNVSKIRTNSCRITNASDFKSTVEYIFLKSTHIV